MTAVTPPTGDNDREALASALLHARHPDNPDAPLPMVRAGCALLLAEALIDMGYRRPATGDAEVLPGDSAPCGCVLGDEEGPSRPCVAHRAEAIASAVRPATGDTRSQSACRCDGAAYETKAHPFLVHPECPVHAPPATGDTLTDTEREALTEADDQHDYPTETDDGLVMRCRCGATPPSHLLGVQVDEAFWLWQHRRQERFAAVERILADRRTGEADLRALLAEVLSKAGNSPDLNDRIRAALATDPEERQP